MRAKDSLKGSGEAPKSYSYALLAEPLRRNGYRPVPISVGTKRPSVPGWTNINFSSESVVSRHIAQFPDHQIGVTLGELLAIDIDCLDKAIADRVQQLCFDKLGASPVRIGHAPKRMLFYKAETCDLRKQATPVFQKNGLKQQVEFLANGAQCVVFGIHPHTQQAYLWERASLLDTPIDALNIVKEDQLLELISDVTSLLEKKCDQTRTPKAALPSRGAKRSDGLATESGIRGLAKDCLNYLDPEEYDTWIAAGHALKSEFGDSALPLFQSWSSSRPNGSTPKNFVNNEDVADRFKSFKPSRTGLNALLVRASRAGWDGLEGFFSGGLSHTAVARFLLENFERSGVLPIYSEGRLWQFRMHHWTEVAHHEMRAWVQELDGLSVGKKRLTANKSFIDGVLNELESMCEVDGFFSSAPLGINCLSGFIAVDSSGEVSLEPHSPRQAQRHVIEARWEAGEPSEIDGLLKKLLDGCFGMGEEAEVFKRLVFQIIGVACSGASRLLTDPKAFICYGQSGANGKSEILNLIRSYLPKASISAVSPEDFSKDQHLASLAGKMANISDELSSSRAIASDKFKQLVTGEAVSAKEIYRKVFSFECRAVHLFATNTLPYFRGSADGGLRRRLIILPFDRIIPRESRVAAIGKKAAKEQGTLILAHAVAALCRAIRRGGYEVPSSSACATSRWLTDSDSVLSWLSDGGLDPLVTDAQNPLIKEVYRRFQQDLEGIWQQQTMPSLMRFSEQLRAWVAESADYEVIRTPRGNIVRKKSLFV